MKRIGKPAWLASVSGGWPPADRGSLQGELTCMGSLVAIQHGLYSQTDAAGVVRVLLELAGGLHPSDAVAVALGGRPRLHDLEVYSSLEAEAPGVPMTLTTEELDAVRLASGPSHVAIDAASPGPAYLAPMAAAGMQGATVLPMIARQRMCGILVLGRHDGAEPHAELRPYMMGLADAGALALGNARLIEESRFQAKIDSLTGLPIRRIFFDRLEEILSACDRNGHSAAVCFIDLDGFKRINDTMGHAAGDQVIRQVAQRLQSCLRRSDSICRAPWAERATPAENSSEASSEEIGRLGGDEFAIVLSKISDPHDASIVAKRVARVFERPFEIEGMEVFLSASIGIAVYPCDGRDADTLLRNADTAMDCAKTRGKNCFQYYTKAMNAEASRRLLIENRLRGALEHREFEVWYQQQRDAESGRLVGAEALLRWDDPDMGMVSPAEFIPLAEQTGCIAAIGERVLQIVCAQLAEWREQGFEPLRMAVNLSPYQLRDEGFVDSVGRILDEFRISPAQLELEITESAIMGDDPSAIVALEALNAMGFSVTLDDFGTGYSSLSYLRRFSLDCLKIDRSFVRELPDNAADRSLTTAIIAMAHGLGLRVVAEGVETEEQAVYLGEKGCDELQGYLFGRPVPAADFADILEREKGEGRR